MKTYSLRLPVTTKETILNYRLSRARRIVENAFGVTVMEFQICCTPIYVCPDKVDKIVKAACALHNWLIKTALRYHAATETMDTDGISGAWRLEPRSNILLILEIKAAIIL